MAKAAELELSEESASAYFDLFAPKSGELADDELDAVSGGGCQTSAGGEKHTVVSSGLPCFTGRYECAVEDMGERYSHKEVWKRTDNRLLREIWFNYCCIDVGPDKTCGSCVHLEFKGGTGYCGVS